MSGVLGYPVMKLEDAVVYEVRPLYSNNQYYWMETRLGSTAKGPFMSIVDATMHYDNYKLKNGEASNVIFVDFKTKKRI